VTDSGIEGKTWCDIFWRTADQVAFFTRCQPREGDRVAIVYSGEMPNRRGWGMPRKCFSIGIDRPEVTAAEW
jgi:hypothetical protein